MIKQMTDQVVAHSVMAFPRSKILDCVLQEGFEAFSISSVVVLLRLQGSLLVLDVQVPVVTGDLPEPSLPLFDDLSIGLSQLKVFEPKPESLEDILKFPPSS